MDFREIKTLLLEKATDNKYTPEQVRSATKTQIASLLSIGEVDPAWSGGNIGFFYNLKENVARLLEAEIFKPKAAQIESDIRAVFPDAEFTAKRRQRIVIVYLDGKPAEDE